MKKTTSIILMSILWFGCQKNKEPHMLAQGEWLIGHWENKSPEGHFAEQWNKINNEAFNGKSFFIVNKDTLFSENIELTQKDGAVFYTATVKGQNNNQPVAFKMTSIKPNEMVFENPKHDYPQKIVYKKINDDSLVAIISGSQQGKNSLEQFPLKRIK
ncbi:hypothetical protein KIH23_06415 [Flavobacterium sp. CYK-55]|uniref:DUF6265 family protein n=1 Tax=Flavobacterium sp. CYK-55 TaxID=2835529 RepID=UPI001BCC2BD7|nr:DUF6265 family protein [Flavobacterium sp. CYK-55]MBS7786924.1 hypothetical protein [Flavobacterium sp. CYK-55]